MTTAASWDDEDRDGDVINQQQQWLRDLFDACDVDHTGCVNVEQFIVAVSHPSSGFGVDRLAAPLVFAALDKDGDGLINFADLAAGFSEFLQLQESSIVSDNDGLSNEAKSSASGSVSANLLNSSTSRDRRNSLQALFAAVEPTTGRGRHLSGKEVPFDAGNKGGSDSSSLSVVAMSPSSNVHPITCRQSFLLCVPGIQQDMTKSSSCPENLVGAWMDQGTEVNDHQDKHLFHSGRRNLLQGRGSVEFVTPTDRSSTSGSSTLAVAELAADVRALQEENSRLEILYSREKDTLEGRLRAFEEEMETALADVEEKAAESARSEFDMEKRRLEGRIDSVKDKMQAHFSLFKKIEDWLAQEERARTTLMKKTHADLTRVFFENKELKDGLVEAQGNMALLHAQLARLRTDHEDKCRELVRKHAEVQEQSAREAQLLQQINLMREASQKLQDTNDSLLGLVESQMSQSGSSNSGFHQHLQDQPQSSRFGPFPALQIDLNNGRIVEGLISNSNTVGHGQPLGLPVHPSPGDFVKRGLLAACDSGRSTLRDLPDDFNDRATGCSSTGSSSGPPSHQEPDQAFHQPRTKAMRRISPPHSNDGISCWSASSSFVAQHVVPSVEPPQQPALGDIKSTYKVVLCGDSAVGKSSFINAVCKGYFSKDIPSTLGVDFQVKVLSVDGETVAVHLWDTAGQEKFRSLVKTYFRRADGVILMYDVTVERSFLNVRRWLQDVEQGAGESVPVVLCANKIDVRDGQEQQTNGRTVSFKAGSGLAAETGCIFTETSAKTGRHLTEALVSLCREMGARQIEEKWLGPHHAPNNGKLMLESRTGNNLQEIEKAESKSSCCSSRKQN